MGFFPMAPLDLSLSNDWTRNSYASDRLVESSQNSTLNSLGISAVSKECHHVVDDDEGI